MSEEIEETSVNNINDYLGIIRKRPNVYLTTISITALWNHIHGYIHACLFNSLEDPLIKKFRKFDEFVADYYLWAEATAGWRNIILTENSGVEEAAFADFFILFDLFNANEKPINSKRILFLLVNKLIIDQGEFSDSAGLEYFGHLPIKLLKVRFKFEYDHILEDIIRISSKNESLSKIINELIQAKEPGN